MLNIFTLGFDLSFSIKVIIEASEPNAALINIP